MFRRRVEQSSSGEQALERIDSVLASGIAWKGDVEGMGGVRIEGTFDGEITLQGIIVIGQDGRVTSNHIRGNTVIVAGSVKGNITAQRVEITPTGRVWGDVTTTAFSTQEGAFLRGQITMEDQLDMGFETTQPSEAAEIDDEHGIETQDSMGNSPLET